jgi:NodT family efflux transporter outer membrane factor (OMF) lipoprotein
MSVRKKSLSLAAALLVSACTVGPNFKRPTAPDVARYDATVPAAAAHGASPPQTIAYGEHLTSAWWELFKSADLDALVKDAVANSRTLESARARMTQAEEVVAAARGALSPQVDMTATVAREKVTAASFGLEPSAFPLPPNFNLYQLGPSARYLLDFFGAAHREVEQRAALAEFQRHQLDSTYLMLTGQVVGEAIRSAAIRSQIQAVDDILQVDAQNLDLLQRARKAGAIPDSDVIRAETQLASDQTLRPPLEQQLSMARHALAVLVGRAPGAWTPPDFDLAGLTLPSTLPVSLPSELVHDRPDILAAEAQLHAASAFVGVTTARLYPSITLTANISTSALEPRTLFDESGLAWGVAAGLTQPIFDGGIRKADRRAALAAFKASAADYQQTVLEAFRQVADLLTALDRDAALLAAQRHALDLAAESLRLQRYNYSRGGIGLLDMLDAQRQYEQARIGFARAEAQRFLDTTRLFVAMGGGLTEAAPTDGKAATH